MSKEDWWWAKIFRGGDADPEKYIYVQYNVAVATLASKGWAIKMHWMQRPKKRVVVRKFYRRGNAGFSHPIWLCRFCRCWSTQYGRLQGAATISCRRTDSCHRTSTVHEIHNFAAQHCPSRLAKKVQDTTGAHQKNLINSSGCFIHSKPTKQVQNSNIPSLQKVWVSHQHFQLSSADWLYLIRLASLRGLKNHLGEHLEWPCSILLIRKVPGLDTTPEYTVAPFE